MIIMAFIDKVSRRLELSPGSGILSYFFCRTASKELSSAESIVRGLIYLLLKGVAEAIGHCTQT
jgi:hypothetical protein